MTMNGTRIAGIVGTIASVIFIMVMVPGVEENRFTGGGDQFYTVGPRFVPYFGGILMLLFSFLMVVRANGNLAGHDGSKDGLGKALLFTLLLVLFSFGIAELGFVLAAAGFLAGTFLCFRSGRPVLSAVIVVTAPVAVDLLLRKVFLVPLPVAPFFN
jgi:hypothetical protein